MATATVTLLTIPETAAVLRCGRDHVYQLISDGVLTVVDIARPGARQPKSRVRSDVLQGYIDARTRNAKP